MAGLIRLGVARVLSSGGVGLGRRAPLCRAINTSSKKTTTTTTATTDGATCPPPASEKNWISYGYSTTDPFVDKLVMHLTAFGMVTMCLVGLGFYFMHAPDPRCQEWAQREAYLELRRRESLGLLPIEPNYYDPATITLPSDEELGDTEIII